MSSVIQIYSENQYLHASINIIVGRLPYLNDWPCSGNVVIIDTGSVTNVDKIIWPKPVCHIIFVISREAHRAFLSSFEWNISVSYINSKSTMDEFDSEIRFAVLNLKRRITCKAFYNVVTQSSLNAKELKMTKYFMHGKSIDRISKEFNLNYKTVANYRSTLLFRAFERIDINGVRVFNVSQNLCKDYMRNNLRFNVNNLYDCPIQ